MRPRAATLIATLILGATAPAAHAGDARPAVILWHSYRGAEKDALDALIAAWNADLSHPERIEALALPSDSFADKLEAAIPRGEGPDLLIYTHDRLGDFVSHGLLQPVGFFVDERTCDRFLRPTLDSLVYDGALWGLPLDFKSVALFYNRALVPTPPATTDDLLRLARALTDPATGRWGLVYEDERLYFFAGWLHGFGGRVLDSSGRLVIDTPAAQAAAAFARTLGGPGGVVPPEMSGAKVAELFGSGKAAMAIDGPWLVGQLDGAPPYAVAPLPVVSATGKPAGPYSGTEAVFLSSRAHDPAAAYQVMEYLTSDASARLRAHAARQLVANAVVWNDPEIANDPILAGFRSQILTAVPMPSVPAMQSVWSTYDLALEEIVGHGADPAAALAKAQHDVRHLLDLSGLDGQGDVPVPPHRSRATTSLPPPHSTRAGGGASP